MKTLIIAMIFFAFPAFAQMAESENLLDSSQNLEPANNDVYNINRTQYDDLYRLCAANKCCRSSVRHMRSAMGTPTTYEEGCRGGIKPSSARCPGSLLWCEYQRGTTKPLPQ